MSTTITFLGAAETVTGSRFLVESPTTRLLVDCGSFQGLKKLRVRNWQPLPFDPSSLDAVLFTHAHIDHSGYFPRLCNLGFSRDGHCTHGTRDLLRVLLPDSGYLHEEAARHANKWGYSKHAPALPLYTREDAERSLTRLKPVGFDESFEPAKGVSARFTRAGHIVGSGCLELRVGGTTITFTGDVGRPNDPIMRPPRALRRTDYLVCESTYGDRRHPEEDVAETLASLVHQAVAKRGVVLVPSFAVGRTQHVLHIVAKLKHERRIPDVPVFLDSPMAIKATRIFHDHAEDHRLDPAECDRMVRVAQFAQSADESRAITARSGPMIVIAASGMATGGRVLHHLKRFLPDANNAVLFVGFQAAGTRGRSLVDGADEVKIHGEYIPVRASVIEAEGLSAHADYKELLDWLAAGDLAPKRAFVVHGEASAADAFRRRLSDRFGWKAVVPEDGSKWTLE